MEWEGFALPSKFELIQDFFATDGLAPKLDSSGNVTFYTKTEIAEIFGLTSYGLTIEQYQYDDQRGDYAWRNDYCTHALDSRRCWV
jgi:hypothetical protein